MPCPIALTGIHLSSVLDTVHLLATAIHHTSVILTPEAVKAVRTGSIEETYSQRITNGYSRTGTRGAGLCEGGIAAFVRLVIRWLGEDGPEILGPGCRTFSRFVLIVIYKVANPERGRYGRIRIRGNDRGIPGRANNLLVEITQISPCAAILHMASVLLHQCAFDLVGEVRVSLLP